MYLVWQLALSRHFYFSAVSPEGDAAANVYAQIRDGDAAEKEETFLIIVKPRLLMPGTPSGTAI